MASATWAQLMDRAATGTGGGAVVPDGVYQFVVYSAQYKTASTGSDMIEAVLKVQGGPYDGQNVWNNFVIKEDNPNALSIFKRHMSVLGIEDEHLRTLPEPTAVGLATLAEWMLGRSAMMVIGHHLFNQQVKNDVLDIKPIGDASVIPGTVPAPPAPAAAPPVPVAPATAPQPVAPAVPAAAPPAQAPLAPVAAPVAPVAPVAPASVPQAPQAPAQPVAPAAAPVAQPAAPAAAPVAPVGAAPVAPPPPQQQVPGATPGGAPF